jgi:hypothetical protein
VSQMTTDVISSKVQNVSHGFEKVTWEIYRCYWNTANYKWKHHNGKVAKYRSQTAITTHIYVEVKTSLKIPKGYSESVHRRTDKTMIKRTQYDLQNITHKFPCYTYWFIGVQRLLQHQFRYILASLIESFWLQGSYWTKNSFWLSRGKMLQKAQQILLH